jgi:hypothetical protein
LDKSTDKLKRDLSILTAMAQEMGTYLDSDVLFWHMSAAGMPALTLGGYLMREHRLLALEDQLSNEEGAELDATVIAFNNALSERIVRFEEKAHRELEARLRQWNEYLKDVERGVGTSKSNYATVAEVRAMIEALRSRLQLPPYELDARLPQQITLLDNQLRRLWRPGEFVWPEEWVTAYPQAEYWWLYGKPRDKKE